MSKKIYISGPVTERPEQNIQEFRIVEMALRKLGHKPVVPHDIFDGIDTGDFTYEDYLRHCIAAMCHCDEVVTLMDFHLSKGATIEVQIARTLNIPVHPVIRYISPNDIRK